MKPKLHNKQFIQSHSRAKKKKTICRLIVVFCSLLQSAALEDDEIYLKPKLQWHARALCFWLLMRKLQEQVQSPQCFLRTEADYEQGQGR